MSTSRALITMCLAVASLLGCKPEDEQPPPAILADDAGERFAQQICASWYACACDQAAAQFASEDECVAQLRETYEIRIDELLNEGATWNADCAGQLVASWSSWECLGPNQAWAKGPFDARVCPIVKGNFESGAECDSSLIGDQCAAGSVCVGGVCITTAVPISLGDVCEYDWQQLPCVAGSFCSYDQASGVRICKPLPALGDSCSFDDGFLCGEPSQGLICSYETYTCEPAPTVDEPCFDGYYCGANNYCDGGKDFTCQQRFELGDSCGADAVCPVDASCVGSICEADSPAVCSLGGFNF